MIPVQMPLGTTVRKIRSRLEKQGAKRKGKTAGQMRANALLSGNQVRSPLQCRAQYIRKSSEPITHPPDISKSMHTPL